MYIYSYKIIYNSFKLKLQNLKNSLMTSTKIWKIIKMLFLQTLKIMSVKCQLLKSCYVE